MPTTTKSRYNPYKVHRKVRPAQSGPDFIGYVTKSFTDAADDSDRYHPTVDRDSGECFCDCPDFEFKHSKAAPTIWEPWNLCKHVKRVAANLERKGQLPDKPKPVGEVLASRTPEEYSAHMAARCGGGDVGIIDD